MNPVTIKRSTYERVLAYANSHPDRVDEGTVVPVGDEVILMLSDETLARLKQFTTAPEGDDDVADWDAGLNAFLDAGWQRED